MGFTVNANGRVDSNPDVSELTGKITFLDRDQYTTVKVDGRMVGRILLFINKGWAYVPKGGKRDEFEALRETVKYNLRHGSP